MGVTLYSLRKTAVNSNIFTSVLLMLLKVWEFLRLSCITRIPKLCQSPAPTPKVQTSKATTLQKHHTWRRDRKVWVATSRKMLLACCWLRASWAICSALDSAVYLSKSAVCRRAYNERSDSCGSISFLLTASKRLCALLKLSHWALNLEIQQNKLYS